MGYAGGADADMVANSATGSGIGTTGASIKKKGKVNCQKKTGMDTPSLGHAITLVFNNPTHGSSTSAYACWHVSRLRFWASNLFLQIKPLTF